MNRFLTPTRAKFETGGALFFAGFGLWIWIFTLLFPETGPISWMRVSLGTQLIIGQVFSVAAIIHGLGVWINGRWQWSPALRLIGMFGHSSALSWMVFNTPNPFSTAVYVYAVASVVMVLGTFNALEDCALACRKKSWTP